MTCSTIVNLLMLHSPKELPKLHDPFGLSRKRVALIQVLARNASIVGHGWSPTEILKVVKKKDPVAFEKLTTQVIGSWIDRSGDTTTWKASVLARVEAGHQKGQVT
jgi:hypothetical protein